MDDLTKPGPWRDAHWLTVSGAIQVRDRPDGDVDIRSLDNDEFGRQRWSKADRCPAAYWRAEGCECDLYNRKRNGKIRRRRMMYE